MAIQNLIRINTISEAHQFLGLPKPENPLISIVNYADFLLPETTSEIRISFDFYSISIKKNVSNKLYYGQQRYDFDEGILFFMSPKQILKAEIKAAVTAPSGWVLLIHADFLWNTSLAQKIKEYDFFDYSAYEALFLSEKENAVMNEIIQNMQHEYQSNIDKFSKQIMVSHIENMLSYAERFYNRQFITREKPHHQVLERLEVLLDNYFVNKHSVSRALLTVQFVAEKLNISPNYLSRLLKTLTGQSTQHLIHEKLIEKAKEKLSTTDLSVGEIAYELGFEHLQSFSKLFKTKTKVSPLEFRQSFN
jgi:AraC family transcriptional activator of pobA